MTTPFIFSTVKASKSKSMYTLVHMQIYLNFAMYSKSGVSLPLEVMVAPATTLPILSCMGTDKKNQEIFTQMLGKSPLWPIGNYKL